METATGVGRIGVGLSIWGRVQSLALSRLGSVALGVVALALLSQVVIPLPFTPVPVSLGTLGALLLGVFLGPSRGMVAAGTYAVLGAVGLPVLAGFQSGVMLASFGYAIGYIAVAGVVGVLVSRRSVIGYGRGLAIAVAGSLSVYVFGLSWMMLVFQMPFAQAVTLGFLPFMIGDGLKILVVAGVIRVVKR